MNLEGDVVLIHYRDEPAMYARIEAIEADVKKDWYRVTFLLLTIPSQTVTWILREEYFNGTPFTMGGNPMMITEVKSLSPSPENRKARQSPHGKGAGKSGKIIPLKKNPEK